jgi:ubiquinol-cytochrome c reductase cytochrome b subunit
VAGLFLSIQILSGFLLSMHYVANVQHAFVSVERIMRSVPNGWCMRYVHSNGASFFFIAIYCHILRGLYYASYKAPRKVLWVSGFVLYLLSMATAFIGYVLPWGEMSF